MEGQLEAIREQTFDQQPQLRLARHTFDIGLTGDIELLGFEPGRTARDLTRVEAVGEGDEIVHGGVDREHLARAERK